MMLVSDGDMHVFDIAHSRTIKHMQCKGMPAGGIHRAVCKDETCRTTGACQKRWSTVDCHNLSKYVVNESTIYYHIQCSVDVAKRVL